MKKKLLVLLLGLSFSMYSQNYIPLLDNYNEWQVTSCYFGCLTDAYYTDGDTIVGGQAYKILDGYHYISRTFLLREVIDSQKIYLNILNDPRGEYLLYDFDMVVGDSIDMKNPITPFPADAGYYRLDSIIPRALHDGNAYDHYYLSPTPSNNISTTNAIWIEGVGSLSLINAPSGFPDINNVAHLSCFFKNGDLKYSNLDSIDACNPSFELNINSLKPLSDVVLVNPITSDNFVLENIQSVSKIRIYDFAGRLVNILKNDGQRKLEVDISKFQAGNYFVSVFSNRFEKQTFKLIVK